MVGYSGATNQYRVWDPIRKDIIISRDVIFNERSLASPVTIVNTAPARYDEIDIAPARYDEVAVAPVIHDEITVLPLP